MNLFRTSKELGISKDYIISHLKSNGFIVKDRPNFKISDEMLNSIKLGIQKGLIKKNSILKVGKVHFVQKPKEILQREKPKKSKIKAGKNLIKEPKNGKNINVKSNTNSYDKNEKLLNKYSSYKNDRGYYHCRTCKSVFGNINRFDDHFKQCLPKHKNRDNTWYYKREYQRAIDRIDLNKFKFSEGRLILSFKGKSFIYEDSRISYKFNYLINDFIKYYYSKEKIQIISQGKLDIFYANQFIKKLFQLYKHEVFKINGNKFRDFELIPDDFTDSVEFSQWSLFTFYDDKFTFNYIGIKLDYKDEKSRKYFNSLKSKFDFNNYKYRAYFANGVLYKIELPEDIGKLNEISQIQYTFTSESQEEVELKSNRSTLEGISEEQCKIKFPISKYPYINKLFEYKPYSTNILKIPVLYSSSQSLIADICPIFEFIKNKSYFFVWESSLESTVTYIFEFNIFCEVDEARNKLYLELCTITPNKRSKNTFDILNIDGFIKTHKVRHSIGKIEIWETGMKSILM